MAKTLYLVRHAQATWQPESADYDRELTAAGKSDAKWVSQKAQEKKIYPEIWLSSSAARTKQTLEIFQETLELHNPAAKFKKELYLAPVKSYLNEIEKFDDTFNSAIIFGHNPGIQELIEHLSNVFIVDVTTSTLYEIEFPEADSWVEISGGTGEIKQVITPEIVE